MVAGHLPIELELDEAQTRYRLRVGENSIIAEKGLEAKNDDGSPNESARTELGVAVLEAWQKRW